MPIYRIGSKLVDFIHIPKTGGTSLETSLGGVAAAVGFHDPGWFDLPRKARWSRNSAQHVDAEVSQRIFGKDFFDLSFAIVRHPEDRIISEYRFRASYSPKHAALPFDFWLSTMLAAAARDPFVFDNHIRPQSDFLTEGCRIFRLEEGLDKALEWLAAETGVAELARVQPRGENRSTSAAVNATARDRAAINAFYAGDFERLGYEPRPIEDAGPGQPGAGLLALAGRLVGDTAARALRL